MGRLASTARPFGPVYLKPDDGHAVDGMPFAPSFVLLGQRVTLRGAPATMDDLGAGIALLRRHLWSQRVPPKLQWKPRLLNHLRTIYPSSALEERVRDLPDVDPCVRIHGDATLANLVRYPFGVRWIDPLDRPYVPGDPLVDVGKVLQSLHGYELTLDGNPAHPWPISPCLTDQAMTGLRETERERAQTWTLVHLARLLRYHSRDVQNWAYAILVNHGCDRA